MLNSAPQQSSTSNRWTMPGRDTDYEDVLGERRGQSDLRWAAQEWQSSGGFKAGTRVSHDEAVYKVLNSQRVKQSIKRVSEAEGKPAYQLRRDVSNILQTMAHSQDISAIRKFAFTLPKIMKTICDKLLVHRPGIERLRRLLRQHPVVLLPTHRSYADFLLVSYLTFHYSLPFPVIAAGMDFIHMAYIGTLFREAGAFYIKRSFMDDDLYWAVFQEYVHVLVCCESAPMEFFLEGTRSRTGKSLRPKLGLLGCVCQCCWRQHTDDVLLVPLNISYSRTLEEELYAYELLGVPKPKESTSGLFKAKNILSEQYGDIFVHVGAPVSAAAVMGSESLLRNPTLTGDHRQHDISPLSPAEMCAVERVGVQLIREQQRMAVVSSFSLAAHLLLAAMQRSADGKDLPHLHYNKLLQDVQQLVAAVQDSGPGPAGYTMWEGRTTGESVSSTLLSSLSLHHNIVTLGQDGLLRFIVREPQPRTLAGGKVGALCADSLTLGVQQMLLQHYANQSLHLLVRPALLRCAVIAQSLQDAATGCTAEQAQHEPVNEVAAVLQRQLGGVWTAGENAVKQRFFKLLSLFGHDFIFAKGSEEEDYKEAVSRLSGCGGLQRQKQQQQQEEEEDESRASGATGSWVLKVAPALPADAALLKVYVTALAPFIFTYSTAILVASQQEWSNESALVSCVQQRLQEHLHSSAWPPGMRLYSALSQDSIRNAIRALTKCGGLRSVRNNGSASPSKLVPCERVLQEQFRLLSGTSLPHTGDTTALRSRL